MTNTAMKKTTNDNVELQEGKVSIVLYVRGDPKEIDNIKNQVIHYAKSLPGVRAA